MKYLLAFAALCLPLYLFAQGFGSFSHDQPFFAGGTTIALTSCQSNAAVAVADWESRVIAAGGAAPSDATKTALKTFYSGLCDTNILTNMIAVCCFVPDNLIASITPLINGGGSSNSWQNFNFVGADLTVNGLKGNGSNKYLNTGVVGVANWITNIGITIYTPSDVGTGCQIEIGAYVTGSSLISLYHSCGGSDYFDSFDTSSGRVGPVSNSGFLGYVSGNRTATNATAIYKGNSTNGHTTQITGSTLAGSPPGQQLFCFAENRLGTPLSFSSKRMSFASVNRGLTSSQSAAFYGLIQTLRTNLGGGYF